LAPVSSALATALKEIQTELASKNYDSGELEEVKLPSSMSRRSRGAINLLRVGLMHAQATGLVSSPEDIVESSFAISFLSQESRNFARDVLSAQDRAIKKYLQSVDGDAVAKIAELGLSLETLEDLREFVEQMDEWQLRNMGKLFYGGSLNLKQVPY